MSLSTTCSNLITIWPKNFRSFYEHYHEFGERDRVTCLEITANEI